MASRRKSTTPCMVPPREEPVGHSDQEMEEVAEAEEEAAAAEDGSGLMEEEGEEDEEAPCQVPPQSGDQQVAPNATEGGYECKYCSFRTAALNLFTMHVSAEHPDVVINTSYICVECDYHTKSYDALLAHNAHLHPGEDNFTRTMVRRNNETVVQQTVNDLTFDGSFIKTEEGEDGDAGEEPWRHGGIALSKTPIMRARGRAEPKKFAATAPKMAAGEEDDDVIKLESDEDEDEDDEEEEEEDREPPTLSPAPGAPAAAAPVPRLVPMSAALQVQAMPQSIVVNSPNVLQFKGGVGGATVLPPAALAQVLSALQQQHQQQQQQQQNGTQTQLLIPISSIPTYSATMDSNVLLLSAYNRFPYPSPSEITGLSSQTKFSEEQIKVWFSAQRLKHGVSWTPEEVEEARKKKFNGTVQTVPQTITVIPANIAASGLQSIFQTCQIVGQPGLVLTQVAGNSTPVPVASPITLTVAGVTGNQPKAAEPSTSESNTEIAGSSTSLALGLDTLGSKPKKSKEQLAELKASYGRRQFASEAEISRLMQVTRLSKRAIKKWFSDTRYNQRNSRDQHGVLLNELSPSRGVVGSGRARRSSSGSANNGNSDNTATIVIDSSDDASDASPTSIHAPTLSGSPVTKAVKVRPAFVDKLRHAFPDFTPQRFKEKTPEQLFILEASFQKSDMPSDDELSRLRVETKLTRREVDAWFTERRKMSPVKDVGDAEIETETAKPVSPPLPLAGEKQKSPPSSRKIVKKTPEQLHILKKAFVRTQWPTSEEYDEMSEESGLSRPYIVNWFGDTRYACKNSNLKWYYLYQSGKGDEALNGGVKKKSRKRNRGWSRRSRRSSANKRSPQAVAPVIKVKSGKTFLKDYYLKHGVLGEKDLDELVMKSSMSYEQVRDWFAETAKRKEEGKEPFSDEEQAQEEGDDKEEEEEAEEASTVAEAAEHTESDGEMEVKEQGEEVSDDCIDEDEEQEDEAEGVGQSEPEAQT